MKKLLLLLAPLTLGLMVGCAYDDSQLRETIEQMQEEQDEMQEQVDAQQTLLNALANNLSIVSVLESEEGYVVTFSDGSTITIKHGEDGKDGADGQDGKDGDSLFQSVTWDEEYAYFTLADGTVISIPLSEGTVERTVEVIAIDLFGFQDHGMLGFALSDVGFLEDEGDGSVFSPNSRNYILVLTLDTDDYSVVPQGTFTTEAGDFETRDGCFYIFMGEEEEDSSNIIEAVVVVSEGKIEATFTLENGEVHHVVYEGSLKLGESVEDDPAIPNNEIWYTSSDGAVVTPYATDVFGANIVSNTYENGQGVIVFDGEVTSIGNYAFYDCSSLASVTIPDSVTSIGYYAFFNCSSLTSVTIPDSVTSIGESAFSYCESLTSVTIGDGVTSIGNYAFYYCSSLTSVTIPDSVTSIGSSAFCFCSSLASVTIGDSVTSIGSSAFQGCKSLTSITIPDSVTSIGESAFRNCTSLTSVYCKPPTPPTGGDYMFSRYDYGYKPIGCYIYVPTPSVSAYKAAFGWSDYASYIVGYDSE